MEAARPVALGGDGPVIDDALILPAQAPAARLRRPWALLADRGAGTLFLICTLVLVALIFSLLGFLAWRGAGAFIAIPGNTDRVLSLREVFLGLDWSPGQDRFGV